VVVGGGDRAMEEAILLSGYARKVTVIHRRSELRASAILQEKARSNPKINFTLQTIIEEITGKDKVSSVRIKNVTSGSSNNLECQGVFIFAGIKPNTDFVKDVLKLDESGFIITDEDLGTSQRGVFACGDCRKKLLYQVVTACADGAVAAASAHRYLL
jgi:thioredoxin reductase (NADPH)